MNSGKASLGAFLIGHSKRREVRLEFVLKKAMGRKSFLFYFQVILAVAARLQAAAYFSFRRNIASCQDDGKAAVNPNGHDFYKQVVRGLLIGFDNEASFGSAA